MFKGRHLSGIEGGGYGGWGTGAGRGGWGGGIFISLLYYMFQGIILFVFFGGKKLIIFTDGGYPPPVAENSAKKINLIFATFPNLVGISN